ncbi:MAG: hypothetical protein IJZ82_12600 [Lachnospiraceae bacterium]|nr:hypothetical protein [Lachnospiraceae bacterium]
MIKKVPNHPILTIILNIFSIAAVFGFAFGLYGLANLFLLKPEDMNVEAVTRFTAICIISCVIASPITYVLLKKARRIVAEDISQGKISKRVY